MLRGLLFCVAMPRGSGKTTLCEVAALWAAVYGHQTFIMLLACSDEKAKQSLETLATSIETNGLLAEDFPEVCYPIAKLEKIAQRASGQLYKGYSTYIGWTGDQLVLPTIEGSAASGIIVRVSGITGNFRGTKFLRPDGTSVRPSVVVIDDPQTDESAESPSQTDKRHRIINGAVLGLAGPNKKIAGLAAVTVIAPDDLADRMLDVKKCPAWSGDRSKMMYSMPTHMGMWDQYAEMFKTGLEVKRSFDEATEFYRANQAKMDEGAKPGWPARFNVDEISAVQHAMNILFSRGEEAFWAEYQNEPKPRDQSRESDLQPDAIAKRLNGYARGVVPAECVTLTMMVDVQDACFYWVVIGWAANYTGHVIDYGTEPEQPRRYFMLKDVKKTLSLQARPSGASTMGAVFYAGLEALARLTIAREWSKPDGTIMRIDRCLIDANYEASQNAIYEFCRQSVHAPVLMPSRGRYVGASSKPMNDWQRSDGEKVGDNWRTPKAKDARNIRHLFFDTNYWKTHVARSLAVAKGDPGGLWFYGSKADEHRLLSEHLTAEYPVKTSGRGREVVEWKAMPNKPDNHWWDCVVGSTVAASMQGVRAFANEKPPERKKIKLSEKWR